MKNQLKKVRMNISHFRFILFNLKIFGEIVTTFKIYSAKGDKKKRKLKHLKMEKNKLAET